MLEGDLTAEAHRRFAEHTRRPGKLVAVPLHTGTVVGGGDGFGPVPTAHVDGSQSRKGAVTRTLTDSHQNKRNFVLKGGWSSIGVLVGAGEGRKREGEEKEREKEKREGEERRNRSREREFTSTSKQHVA